jgi:LPS O-antigen subunit length determinant protein (WzzB/FepE family)
MGPPPMQRPQQFLGQPPYPGQYPGQQPPIQPMPPKKSKKKPILVALMFLVGILVVVFIFSVYVFIKKYGL